MELTDKLRQVALAVVALLTVVAVAACGGEPASPATERPAATAAQPVTSSGQIGGTQPPVAGPAPTDTPQPPPTLVEPTSTAQHLGTSGKEEGAPATGVSPIAIPTENPAPTQPSLGTTESPATSTPVSPSTPTPQPAATPTPTPQPAATPTLEPTATAAPEPAPPEKPAPPENLAHLFTLPSALDGRPVSLESYRGNKNVVLVFYRGFW